MPFRGVIFDMDGVLCDSEPLIAEAAGRMFREFYGVAVQREQFLAFVGAGEDRYLEGIAEKYGVKIRLPEDKDRTYRIYLQLIRGRLKSFPGVHDFIKQCRALLLHLAIATSADRIKLDGNLREIRLPHDWFDALVTGDEIQRKKPDPEIFNVASRRLGLPPSDCLVVEDAPNGIVAAKKSGARCLAVASSFSETILRAAGADWVLPGLANGMKIILQA